MGAAQDAAAARIASVLQAGLPQGRTRPIIIAALAAMTAVAAAATRAQTRMARSAIQLRLKSTTGPD